MAARSEASFSWRSGGHIALIVFRIPWALAQGGHSDIYEMAGAYLFHIIRNHPFVDGNKRTGAVAAVVFLMMNGIELHAEEASFEAMVRSVAEGRTGKTGAAEFFRKYGAKE